MHSCKKIILRQLVSSAYTQFASKFQANEKSHNLLILLVPGAGLEPARYCYRGILSPLRLPISPPGLWAGI